MTISRSRTKNYGLRCGSCVDVDNFQFLYKFPAFWQTTLTHLLPMVTARSVDRMRNTYHTSRHEFDEFHFNQPEKFNLFASNTLLFYISFGIFKSLSTSRRMKRKSLHSDRKKKRKRCRQRCGHCQQLLKSYAVSSSS